MLNKSLNPVLVRLAIVAAALALLTLVAPVAFADSHTTFEYAENGTDAVAAFAATDEDGDPIQWSLNGADAGDFDISSNGELSFKSSPNFESPADMGEDNVYDVTVQATGGMLEITVTVTNVDEDGSASLNKPQPQAGRSLMASVDDPDGDASEQQWQWASASSASGPWTDIEGATSAIRSPEATDVDSYLRASVTYTDMFGEGKTASVVSANVVETKTTSNAAPSFADQDDVETDAGDLTNTEGIQVNREMAENSATGTNIGDPVSASDKDNDVLIYSIVEDAAGSPLTSDDEKFSIDSGSGQLMVNAELDFEDETDVGDTAGNNTYLVTVKAEDPSGAPVTQDVIITVTNVNEAPAIASGAPTTLWVTEITEITETATERQLRTTKADPGDDTANLDDLAYQANDNDGTELDTAVGYSLEGADKDSFSVDPSTGVLTVPLTHSPDFEKQGSYSITIVAMIHPSTTVNDDSEDRTSSSLAVTVEVVDAERRWVR